MNFKSYTTDTYTVISLPEGALNGNVAEALLDECTGLTESGSPAIILDCAACQSCDAAVPDTLAALHESCYSAGRSLALMGASGQLLSALRESGAADVLNLAPTLAEAVDIISMEALERDLMGEDEG